MSVLLTHAHACVCVREISFDKWLQAAHTDDTEKVLLTSHLEPRQTQHEANERKSSALRPGHLKAGAVEPASTPGAQQIARHGCSCRVVGEGG